VTVTGFAGIYGDGDGDIAKIDAFGNNVAFLCNKCGHPVLAVVRENQRGSSRNNPAVCKACNDEFVIKANETKRSIVIYNVSNPTLFIRRTS